MTDRDPAYAGPRPGISRRRRWMLAFLVLVLAAAGSALVMMEEPEDTTTGPTGPTDPAGPAFGVLGSTCDPERAATLHEAGVRFAELELAWADFEPAPGDYDAEYQGWVRRAVENCTEAGLGVVLTLGLHTAPSWVAGLPGGAYLNQGGGTGPEDVPNVVFSAAVREAVTDYLAELDTVVPLNSFAAVRVGTGGNGELGYPTGAQGADDGNPFWAFGPAAQEGIGLADGATSSPMPGWVPGQATWRGNDVSVDDVRAWFGWYSRSVADAAIWIVRALREQGFEGDIHLPLAGRGALPADLDAAVAARLDGTADRDGSLEGGLYYPEQLEHIAQSLADTEEAGWGRIYADSSSVDDATAVTARRLDPPQDSCQPGDAELDLVSTPGVDQWSSTRWTIANARKAGLVVMGENPGSPDTPRTGGNELTDSSAEQMRQAPRYARECELSLLMWAFEDDLFGERPGAGVADYAKQIGGARSSDRKPRRRRDRKDRHS